MNFNSRMTRNIVPFPCLYATLLASSFKTPSMFKKLSTKSLLRDMSRFSIKKDNRIYQALIHGYLQLGQVSKALKTMEECEKFHMDSSIHLYVSLIDGLLWVMKDLIPLLLRTNNLKLHGLFMKR